MMSLSQVAEALGGKIRGHQVLCPGPNHSSADRSLCVKLERTGKLLVHSFANDDQAECYNYVCRKLGIEHKPHMTCDWQSLWREAQDLRGTQAETYLTKTRGLVLPDRIGEALHFHPSCPFSPGIKTPALIALIRDVVSNMPIGIQRIALDDLGRKRFINGNDKMTLGQMKGGAVKLTPDENVTLALGIGEGIETTLSMQLLPEWIGSPVWACLSAGNLANFPVLGGIESLVVAVDHDKAGRDAACNVIARWHEAGRETIAIEANQAKADLNDLVQG